MIPTKIQVGTRVCMVDQKKRPRLAKMAKGEVWLTEVGGKPFRSKWPMRLHLSTTYKELAA